MGKRMIERDERGITLNKTLAWGMVCGLIGAGIYVGQNIATLSTRIESLSEQSDNAEISRVAHDVRIRSLEAAQARSGAEYEAVQTSLEEIKRDQRENNTLLRQILKGRVP